MATTSTGRPAFLSTGGRGWTGPDLSAGPTDFHRSFPRYRPTALVEVPALAAELDVAAVLVKDESRRMGLPAFKVLGASWAVNKAVSGALGHPEPAATLDELPRLEDHGRRAAAALATPPATVVTAATAVVTVRAEIDRARCRVDLRCVGVAVNTSEMPGEEAGGYLARLEAHLGLPCVDPLKAGVGAIVDRLLG